MDAHVVAFKVTVLKMYVKFLSPNKMSESNLFASLCQDLDRWRIVHRVRTRVLGISLVNLVNSSCFICEVEHDFFGVSVGWASRQVLLQDRSEQCRVCFCPWSRSLPAQTHRHKDEFSLPQNTSDDAISRIFLSLRVFCLLFTLGMQGTLRQWMLALLWARLVTPGSAGYLLWECCILASL